MAEADYPRPFAKYVLLERLGAGGMSEVDLARRADDDATDRFVVIKRIRTSGGTDQVAVRMFLDEAKINAQLSHENIAQVYASGREGDEWFLEMEYVPGLDLRALQQVLASQGKLLPLRAALSILACVLRALQYAHTRVDQLGRPMSIVHRDVNPRNVMVSAHGEIKLIDFGVAKAADRIERTEGNQLKGKFAYMAPEQIESGVPLDGRADLYAVGLMYHELLAGRSPWVGLTEVQILHKVLAGKIPPLPDGLPHPDPALLAQVHARALATRPADRYADADAFRVDLERVLAVVGGPSPAAEIAALLRDATGDRLREIGRRLQTYREASAPSLARWSGSPAGPSPEAIRAAVAAARGERSVSVAAPPPPREPDPAPSSPGWLAVGLGVGGIGLLLVVAVAAVGVIFWALRTDPRPDDMSSPSAVPSEVVAAPVPDAPAVSADATPSASSGSPARPTRPPDTRAAPVPAEAVASLPSNGSATADVPASVPPTPAVTALVAPAVPASSEAAPAEPAAMGRLNLTSAPAKGLEVVVAGRVVGRTPLRLAEVPVGTYDVTVRDPASGRSASIEVTVPSRGASQPYVVTVP